MYGVVVPFHMGDQAFLRGQVGQAEADARVAVDLSHQQGYALANPPWIALLVEILVERDDLAGADAELARAGLTYAIPDHWWFLGVAFSRARLRLAQVDAAAAVDDLLAFRRLAAETRADPQYIPTLSYLSLALLACRVTVPRRNRSLPRRLRGRGRGDWRAGRGSRCVHRD